jgi:F-type H+-transporting ATPase subunit epsilon
MAPFSYTIESPLGRLAAGEAVACTIPGLEGQLTILPSHAPGLFALQGGACVCIKPQGEEEVFAVAGGIVEVLPGGAVRAVVEMAEWAEGETEAIEQAVSRAKEAMAAATQDGEEYALLAATLERELARFHAGMRRRGKR